MNQHSKLLGGILLVAGTTIGAAMLALPVITGFAGFFPALLLFILFWAYMTYTALLMLEVNVSSEGNLNLISMVRNSLGPWGEAISWIVYLFLLYSLTTAYIAGSGPIFIDFIQSLTGYQMPLWLGPIPLLLIFGFFVYKGTQSVDYANRFLMIGLAIAYLMMVIFLTPHVQLDLLTYKDWKYFWMGVPIIATSFGFHIIIPSLTKYMGRDIKLIKNSILIGSLIPLIVYVIWEFLTLGIIPLSGLEAGYAEGTNGAHLLTKALGNSAISMVARFFSFFAIVTSFLGVSLSLSHFLEDGFKIKEGTQGRLLTYLLTFLPPLGITLADPRAFLTALEYAGAFGVVVLLGLFPALMAWQLRYKKQEISPYRAPGEKWPLLLVILLSLFVIGLELANKTGLLSI
jgi:tyrosine-specific transport protein